MTKDPIRQLAAQKGIPGANGNSGAVAISEEDLLSFHEEIMSAVAESADAVVKATEECAAAIRDGDTEKAGKELDDLSTLAGDSLEALVELLDHFLESHGIDVPPPQADKKKTDDQEEEA
jgi:hypothetical protein